MNVENFVFKIFGLKKNKKKELLTQNFFQSGLIDSIKFIEIISLIERRYKIKFSYKEFNSPKNFTIKNLIGLIKKSDKKNRYNKTV